MSSWFGKKSKQPEKLWISDNDRPKVSSPFPRPPSDIKNKPELQDIENDEQKKYYDSLLKHFETTELYPITEKHCVEKDYKPLNEEEKAWLSRQCFLRYLRACDWKLDDTIKRLTGSIAWRREFGIAGGEFTTLTAKDVKMENETGKQMVYGFDNECRPCLYLFNGRQNTKTSFKQIQHLIFMLESSIAYMPIGQDKLCLCVDFKKYPEGCTYESRAPAVSVGKQVLSILQYHYPERLGRALFINIPLLIWTFLKICWPFVDNFTKQKCKFDEPFKQFIEPQQLPLNYGGDINFEYNHDEYWDQFVEITDKNREKIIENYKKLGGGIGLSELDLKEGFESLVY